MRVTHAWWRERRFEFDLYMSQVVLDEAAAGDPEAALGRVEFLEGLPLLGYRARSGWSYALESRRCVGTRLSATYPLHTGRTDGRG
jgi:hypothetical protein